MKNSLKEEDEKEMIKHNGKKKVISSGNITGADDDTISFFRTVGKNIQKKGSSGRFYGQ